MAYLDFFVVPLPQGKEQAYKSGIEHFWSVMKDYGCLRYCEALAENVPHGEMTDYYQAVAAKEGETVIAAFAVWPDKETRDRAWNEGMRDPRMESHSEHMALFDGKRLIFGGFTPLVEFNVA